MKIKHIEPEIPDRDQLAKLAAAAKTKHKTAIAQVERYRCELEKLTGCPIKVKRGAFDLDTDGMLTFVPGKTKPDGNYFIALRSIEPLHEPYVLARLLAQLEFEHKDCLAGEPVIFAPNTSCIQSTLPHREASQSEQRKSATSFGNTLISLTREMFIESHLATKTPALAPLQKRQSLFWGYQRSNYTNMHLQLPEITPRDQACATICAANALQWEHLLNDTKISEYYRQLSIWPRAESIHGIFKKHFSGSNPGAIGQTIKEVCTLLGNPDMIRHHKSPVLSVKANRQPPSLKID